MNKDTILLILLITNIVLTAIMPFFYIFLANLMLKKIKGDFTKNNPFLEQLGLPKNITEKIDVDKEGQEKEIKETINDLLKNIKEKTLKDKTLNEKKIDEKEKKDDNKKV
jgi:hypothetical protein